MQPCINHFDTTAKRCNWNIEFKSGEILDLYYNLSDINRWQVSNLLMENDSPMLWFYLQRQDSDIPRKSEKEICDEFLKTVFAKGGTFLNNYILNEEGEYLISPRKIPCPAPSIPQDPLIKKIYEQVNSNSTMLEIFEKLKIETSFYTVNKIRINLTSSGFPYLKAT